MSVLKYFQLYHESKTKSHLQFLPWTVTHSVVLLYVGSLNFLEEVDSLYCWFISGATMYPGEPISNAVIHQHAYPVGSSHQKPSEPSITCVTNFGSVW